MRGDSLIPSHELLGYFHAVRFTDAERQKLQRRRRWLQTEPGLFYGRIGDGLIRSRSGPTGFDEKSYHSRKDFHQHQTMGGKLQRHAGRIPRNKLAHFRRGHFSGFPQFPLLLHRGNVRTSHRFPCRQGRSVIPIHARDPHALRAAQTTQG